MTHPQSPETLSFRAWEAARVLQQDFSDRLNPYQAAVVLAALRADAIGPAYATEVLDLYGEIAGVRV